MSRKPRTIFTLMGLGVRNVVAHTNRKSDRPENGTSQINLTQLKHNSMINDIDTQEIYGIMSMEEIEQMFTQIERRIGVHERDVVVLEDRTRAFSDWWIQQQAPAPMVIEEETEKQQRIYGAMDVSSIKGIRQQGEDG
jgi:hypothetical protein